MICLRCGYCCIHSDVIIVKPEYCDDELDPDALTEKMLMHKKHNEHCPHLSLDGGIASCLIHHYKWFEHTPCHSHNNDLFHNKKCTIGTDVVKYGTVEKWKDHMRGKK